MSSADNEPQEPKNSYLSPESTDPAPQADNTQQGDKCLDSQASGYQVLSSDTTAANTAPQKPGNTEHLAEDTELPLEPLTWNNLWGEAYERLKAGSEYSYLVEYFEKYLVDGKDVAENGAG